MLTRIVSVVGLVAAMLAASLPAHAQTVGSAERAQRGKTFDESRERARFKPAGDLSKIGHPIADGIVVVPLATVEVGHDSNPDELFDELSARYAIVDAGVVVGIVKPNGASTIAVKGSALRYDGEVLRKNRWDAGISFDSIYKGEGGLELQYGAFYLRDGINLTQSETTGANTQLSFENARIETFVRVRAEQLRYLGGVAFANRITNPALLARVRNGEFNVARIEPMAGVLIGRNRRIGVYGQVGAARIDYTDQRFENATDGFVSIDRDGDDFWGLGGFRLLLHPRLRADLGYRYNQRKLDDMRITEFSSNYFDASILWVPKDNLVIKGEVDRKIREPSTAFSLLADVISYNLSAVYTPTERLNLSLLGGYDRIREIGDRFIYKEQSLAGQGTYQLNDKVQLYGVLLIKKVREESTGDDYRRLRVGIGAKAKF